MLIENNSTELVSMELWLECPRNVRSLKMSNDSCRFAIRRFEAHQSFHLIYAKNRVSRRVQMLSESLSREGEIRWNM